MEDAVKRPLDAAVIRTPWWEDLRRCVEGEWTPSRWEGWNHPVAGESRCIYDYYVTAGPKMWD